MNCHNAQTNKLISPLLLNSVDSYHLHVLVLSQIGLQNTRGHDKALCCVAKNQIFILIYLSLRNATTTLSHSFFVCANFNFMRVLKRNKKKIDKNDTCFVVFYRFTCKFYLLMFFFSSPLRFVLFHFILLLLLLK